LPYPITRIPTDDAAFREVRSEELRNYIEQQMTAKFSLDNPDFLLDVVVARRSDYDQVKVFVTKAALVNDAKAFLSQLEDELAAEGIAILTYVRTWTGPETQRT
jgi:hypothetical protein